ncbi:MAG: type II toxin-antitoxin system VapC family toxin [Blastochloris sp.]|nr:type II toxin-antitoxin system VapC family toxin [Blastochloris sp.]
MNSVSFFIDTGGFYALINHQSPQHQVAVAYMEKAQRQQRRAVTSDYILDETATLFRARKLFHLTSALFDLAERSRALETVRVDVEIFVKTKALFLKYHDHDFSFTDCSSFVLMKEFRLKEALATDAHFREAGFVPVLT